MCMQCEMPKRERPMRLLDVVQVRKEMDNPKWAGRKGIIIGYHKTAKAYQVLFVDSAVAYIHPDNLIRIGPAIGE